VIGVACLLLLAAASRVEQTDEDVYQIAPGDYQWVTVDLRQQPAVVKASYVVEAGSGSVRLMLVTRDEYDHTRDNLAQLPDDARLASTPRGRSGEFTVRVRQRDSYVILLDNHADKANPATVRMRVSLIFNRPTVTQLPPGKQFTVVAVSVAAFFAMVTWSARKLLKAARG